MAQSGAIGQLFLLIRSCNRSVPCMEVVSYAVQVLLHVAKVALQFAEQVLTQVRSAMRCPCARPRMSMPSPVRASAGVLGAQCSSGRGVRERALPDTRFGGPALSWSVLLLPCGEQGSASVLT